jgi:hypothetical protein
MAITILAVSVDIADAGSRTEAEVPLKGQRKLICEIQKEWRDVGSATGLV